MVVITSSELEANQNKFFDMAEKEPILVKRGKFLFELRRVPQPYENPSPSGDPWFNHPKNRQLLQERIEEYKKGEGKGVSLSSEEDIQSFLENLE
ncbi:hypothetical protein M2480_000371 [Parabacteroides sp. PFB2-12]|nr:hypothetical protein [Parabacteroides sp. PM6-13]MDH6389411.1 hypothetical protein [Parabacteroides sp. PFB2-12]